MNNQALLQDVVFERPEEDMENTWKLNRKPQIEIEEVKEEKSIGTIEISESERSAVS